MFNNPFWFLLSIVITMFLAGLSIYTFTYLKYGDVDIWYCKKYTQEFIMYDEYREQAYFPTDNLFIYIPNICKPIRDKILQENTEYYKKQIEEQKKAYKEEMEKFIK